MIHLQFPYKMLWYIEIIIIMCAIILKWFSAVTFITALSNNFLYNKNVLVVSIMKAARFIVKIHL